MTNEEKERAEWLTTHGWKWLLIGFLCSGTLGLVLLAVMLYIESLK